MLSSDLKDFSKSLVHFISWYSAGYFAALLIKKVIKNEEDIKKLNSQHELKK